MRWSFSGLVHELEDFDRIARAGRARSGKSSSSCSDLPRNGHWSLYKDLEDQSCLAAAGPECRRGSVPGHFKWALQKLTPHERNIMPALPVQRACWLFGCVGGTNEIATRVSGTNSPCFDFVLPSPREPGGLLEYKFIHLRNLKACMI